MVDLSASDAIIRITANGEHTMNTDDQLIEACERMGYGVDINFRTGAVTVTRGRGQTQKFKSIEAALVSVRTSEAALNAFRNK